MTTTHAEPDTPTSSRRSWWPDRRPVQTWWAVTWLVLGLALAVGTLATGIGGVSSFQDTAFLLVFGVAWVAQAGLEVARPRPGTTSVVVYRVAYFAVPLLMASFAVALLLTG